MIFVDAWKGYVPPLRLLCLHLPSTGITGSNTHLHLDLQFTRTFVITNNPQQHRNYGLDNDNWNNSFLAVLTVRWLALRQTDLVI